MLKYRMDFDELLKWCKGLDVDKLFQMSQDTSFSGSEKSFLYSAAKKLGSGTSLSSKEMSWLYSILEQRDQQEVTSTFTTEESFLKRSTSNPEEFNHLCVRLAWHDSGWNGKICNDPENNIYCVGENSLLSDRMRRNRKLEVECKSDCKGQSANCKGLGEYRPPCFWSINAFGNEDLVFDHENPAEKTYPQIKEKVPPYSVISWPFDLAFVRDRKEIKQYGSYYPKPIFEKRIRTFHEKVREQKSIAFLYCKFSNPVSGEDGNYLLVGCALVSGKGDLNWFNVTEERLNATKEKKGEPNFPTLNWALRYSMDFVNTGVRLPYQEYLEQINKPGGIKEEMLEDIKVVITEPELIDGFMYVAKHVDNDQAIFLLMKLRQSLLKVKEHGILSDYNADLSLQKIDKLLVHAWASRGYLPGLKGLIQAILKISDADTEELDRFISYVGIRELECIDKLLGILSQDEDCENFQALVGDLIDALDSNNLEPKEFVRLSTLSLTAHQFLRVLNNEVQDRSASDIADNPYLLFENYEPVERTNHPISGEKIDGPIDLFKVDIALFPQRKYQKRHVDFHDWKIADKRRVRAVLISILRDLESYGHCYDTSSNIVKKVDQYPLFYKQDEEYRTNLNFSAPPPDYKTHFTEEVVVDNIDHQTIYYLKEVLDAERFITQTIHGLMAAPNLAVVEDPSLVDQARQAATQLKDRLGSRFSEESFVEERKRIFSILPTKRFSVLSGSPGSGKSYELLKLSRFLANQRERYLILSLTGKAVLRLRNNEAGIKNVQAKTIDKFLSDVARNKGVKTIVNTLIIEEASMVDLIKLAEVLRAVDTKGSHFKRLILVGDENQLPPIGYGKPFADIIDSLRSEKKLRDSHYVYLGTNCRAELPEPFVDFTRVFSNEHKMPEQSLASAVNSEGISGLQIIEWKSKDDLYLKLKERFKEISGKGDDLDAGLDSLLGISDKRKKPTAIENFQILSPYRSGSSGVAGLNLLFQSDFRKSKDFTRKVGEIAFKIKDKVMHTKNEYQEDEIFISNGSFGITSGYNTVFFVEKDAEVSFKQLKYDEELELAYAVTVHKSQGSGFGHVFMVVPERKGLLSRELMFTALTRAKKSVTLFIQNGGETKALLAKLDHIRRNSSIAQIRTSLVIGDKKKFAYVPEEGVEVESRVEYIIFKKLREAQASIGGFTFSYEAEYQLPKYNFNFHPDFTIWLPDNRVVYWEHLGRVDDRDYLAKWDRRRRIYEKMGDFDKVITTDELNGIGDEKIESLIKSLLDGSLVTEDSSGRYSNLHLSLR